MPAHGEEYGEPLHPRRGGGVENGGSRAGGGFTPEPFGSCRRRFLLLENRHQFPFLNPIFWVPR